MTATRRQAREWAIQMLTAADLNPTDDIETLISDFWSQHETLDAEDGGDGEKVRGKLKAFAEDRVRGVLQNLSVIDGKLQPLLQECCFASEPSSAPYCAWGCGSWITARIFPSPS